MKTYELTYIISPEITLEQALEKAKELELAIQAREGIILKQLAPVAKTLAFPIAKRASGFVGVLEFQMEPERLLEIKETIAKDGKIVRDMIVIKEPIKIRKERRGKRETAVIADIAEKTEVKPEEPKTETKDKVELKDIEQQLDELLG